MIRILQCMMIVQQDLDYMSCYRTLVVHNMDHISYLMKMLSHPLKPTDDWILRILYFLSEIQNEFQRFNTLPVILTLPIRESSQSPSSCKSRELETRHELQLSLFRATSLKAARGTSITTKFSSVPPFGSALTQT